MNIYLRKHYKMFSAGIGEGQSKVIAMWAILKDCPRSNIYIIYISKSNHVFLPTLLPNLNLGHVSLLSEIVKKSNEKHFSLVPVLVHIRVCQELCMQSNIYTKQIKQVISARLHTTKLHYLSLCRIFTGSSFDLQTFIWFGI